MGFLEQLDLATKLPNVHYHNFLNSYKKDSDDIYVFCEGEADFSYYCEQIEHLCPNRNMHKCLAECKNNVIQIWKYIDWNLYSKNRVLFFVDRDLSYWADEPQYYDTNVYITDEYSFENDAANSHMFLKLLEDLYGFANYSEDEKNCIKNIYIDKWSKFKDGSYELMGCILYKYTTSHDHTANKISLKSCLDISSEDIWNKIIQGQDYMEYYKNRLQIEVDISKTISEYKERFIKDGEHYSVRGKWCIDFMRFLLDYIIESGESFAPSLYTGLTKKPNRILELTPRGAMAIIGPKIIPPKSLISFLKCNLGE